MPNPKKRVCCPVETTIQAIGGRWKVLIIQQLLERPRRFGDLKRRLKGISQNTLTRQLRELAGDGVISREASVQPVLRAEYALTPLGVQLRPVLDAMDAWGAQREKAGGIPAADR